MKNFVAILGVGNMGSAIADGMLSCGFIKPENLILIEKNRSKKLDAFIKSGCLVTEDIESGIKKADAVILAVKPQSLPDVLPILSKISAGKLFISIAAGITVDTLQSFLSNCPIVRVMPNTPLMVGKGVSALCFGRYASASDKAFANSVFSCAGITVEISEAQMNALTALTSSSIAYVARMLGDMCQWAKDNGFENFTEEQLCNMVSMVASGTADILSEKCMTPDQLVRAVASPNGTTEAALKIFDAQNFDCMIYDAMTACTVRANEISQGK